MKSAREVGPDPVTLFFGERQGSRFVLTPEDSHHATRVLRQREGDRIFCIDGSGKLFEVELDNLDPRRAEGVIQRTSSDYHEPSVHLELLCGLTQPARLDWVVEKATELGVHEIRPVLGSFSPGPGRVRRWQRIARGAAKQCRRGAVPLIHEPAGLAEQLSELGEGGIRLWADVGGGPLPACAGADRLILAVGHDSGFTESEKESLRSAAFQQVGLGPRRLRSETAVLTLLSWLLLTLPDTSHGRAPQPEIP